MLKSKYIVLGVTSILLIGGFWLYQTEQFNKIHGGTAPETITLEELKINTDDPVELETVQSKPTVLPKTLNIDMSFYAQAPHGKWDYPWQEACEEASVLLVANVYKKMGLNVDQFNTELLRLVDWEIATFGAYEHTNLAQTAQMMEENYDLQTVVHENPTFQDMQKMLNEGHLIIAPFAGKLLQNPNFKNGGPIYHMLVIKGYNADKAQIITHDVGTRNGANYVYSWETIEKALHDWHDQDILLGQKRILEVLPPL